MSDKTEDTTLEMKLLERELKPDRLSHKDIPSLPENDLIVLFGHYTAEEIARIFHSTTPTISLLQANIRADAESKSKKKYSRLSWDNKDILNYGPTPRAEVLRIFDKVYANRLAKRGRVKNKVKFPHNFFDNDDQMGILTGWRRAKIVFDQYVKKEFGGYDDSLLGLFNTKYFNYDSIMNLKDSIIDNFPEHLMNPHYYSTSQIFKELFRNSVDPEVRARYKDLEIYHFPRFKHWITYKGKPDLELGEKYFREVVLAHAKNGMSVDEIVAGSYRSLCDTDLEIKYGANASQVYRNLKNSSKENERRVIKAIRENLNSLAKDKVRFKHFVDEALLVEHLKSDLKDSEMEYVEAPAPKQLSDEILLKAISYMTSSNSQYVLYHNQARWRFKGQDMKTLKQEYLAQDHNFNPELLITYFEKSMEMTKRENLTGMLTNKAALENGLAARKNFVVLDHVFRNRLNLDYDDSIFDKFRTKLLENNFFNRNYRFAVVNKYFSDSQFAGFVRKFLEEHPDPVVRKFYEGVGNQHFISHIAPASNWSGKWINGDDTPGLRAIKEMFSSYLRQGKSLKDIIEISHFFERKNLMRFNRDPSMINMGFFWGASQAKYRFCKSQHFVDWVNEHDAEYGLEDQIRKDFRFKSAKDMKWRLKTTDIPSFRQIKMSRDDVKRRQITKKVADELKKHQQYGELIEASDSTYLQQLVDIACTVVPETWQLDETINAKEVSKMLLDPLYRDHLTHAERAQRAFHFYKKSTKHHHKVPLLCEWYHKQALVDFFSSFPKHFQDRLDQRVRCLSPHTVSERNDAIENYFLHNRDLERLFGEKYLKNVRLSILGLKAGDLDNFRTIQDQTRKQVLKCRLGMKKWNKLFNNYILTDDFFLSMKKVQDIDFKRRDMKLIRQFAAEHGYHSLATEETLILSDDSQNRGSYRVDIRLPNFDNNAKIKIVSIFTKMMDSSSQVKATEASYNALASIGCNVPAHLSYLANNNILVTEFIDEGKSLLKYIRDKDLNYMCAAKKVVEEMVKVHYLLPE